MAAVRRLLKAVRTTQPFNATATTLVKAALGVAGGGPSETVVKHLHRVGHVRSRLPNGATLRLWSRGDDWVSNQIYWRGWSGYDPETVPLFFQLARKARVVLDVGAYVGLYSLLAGHANPEASVYAFEPLEPIFQRLEHNVVLNRLTNVHSNMYAVGEIDGSAEFYHVGSSLPTSSSLAYEFMSGADDLRRSTVPVVRLDRFAEEMGLQGIDLLKIDTESTEPQVLRGLPTILERDRPHLFCEVLAGRGTEAALEQVLEPLDYRYYHLTPDGPIRQERVVGHREWLNYLFTTLAPDELHGVLSGSER